MQYLSFKERRVHMKYIMSINEKRERWYVPICHLHFLGLITSGKYSTGFAGMYDERILFEVHRYITFKCANYIEGLLTMLLKLWWYILVRIILFTRYLRRVA